MLGHDDIAFDTIKATAPDIELRHLNIFLAVAQESGFTRAAYILHMTQPALSRAVAQLEHRLGVRLFDRTTHTVELTSAGRAFLPYCRNVLVAFHEAVGSARGEMQLRIGFTWSAALELTSLIIREFERRHPQIVVQLRKYDDAYAGSTDGRSHVAFLRGVPSDPGLRSATLFEERRVAAVHPSHPLADCASMTLADIADDPLVVNTVSGITSPGLWPHQRDREIVETRNLEEWLEVVGLGRGVGVTAESTGRLYAHPWIRYIPIDGADPIKVVVAWPEARAHPCAASFVEIALGVAKTRSAG